MKEYNKEKVRNFLEQKSFAVIGYSTNVKQPANAIYNRLKEEGYNVIAVNSKAHLIQDLKCYSRIGSINEEVDVAILCTPRHKTENAIVECSKNGIKRIWIHEGVLPGSYTIEAHETALRFRDRNYTRGMAQLCFLKPDILHKCFRWLMSMPKLD